MCNDSGYRYNEWLAGLRQVVQERRITQVGLAERVGIGREHLNGVLRGRVCAGEALRDRLCSALGYDYDHLRSIGRGGERSDPGIGLPSDSGAVNNNGVVHVENGAVHVTGTVRSCSAPQSCPGAGKLGDIGRDLCAVIARQLDGADLDQQIAFRSALVEFVRQYNNGRAGGGEGVQDG